MYYINKKDIAENAADTHHFKYVHGLPEFTGNLIKKRTLIMKLIEKVYLYKWCLKSYTLCPPPEQHLTKHISYLIIELFGWIRVVNLETTITQIGPGQSYARLKATFLYRFVINTYLIVSIIPMDLMRNKLVQHLYCEPNVLNLILENISLMCPQKL